MRLNCNKINFVIELFILYEFLILKHLHYVHTNWFCLPSVRHLHGTLSMQPEGHFGANNYTVNVDGIQVSITNDTFL